MAQRRRKELMQRKHNRKVIVLCIAGGLGAIALSLALCLLMLEPIIAKDTPVRESDVTAPNYTSSEPFTIADLTGAQLDQLRQQKCINVSDGPRGISIGETLDELLTRFPTSYTGEQPDNEQILYCSQYIENANGTMVALPPRGLLTADSNNIYVTLLSPTSAYPAGTLDNYGDYEHVYCKFTIEPDTMTVTSIVLGLDS